MILNIHNKDFEFLLKKINIFVGECCEEIIDYFNISMISKPTRDRKSKLLKHIKHIKNGSIAIESIESYVFYKEYKSYAEELINNAIDNNNTYYITTHSIEFIDSLLHAKYLFEVKIYNFDNDELWSFDGINARELRDKFSLELR